MRASALLATIWVASIGATSALVDVNDMISGCSPSCTADDIHVLHDYPETYYQCCENTLDGSTSADSRWSCEGDECCIKYFFEDPQDVVMMRIAFHQGDERTRTLDVYDNGNHHSTITSGGNTLYYETFYLNTDESEDIELCLDGDDDEWISITEVKFYAV